MGRLIVFAPFLILKSPKPSGKTLFLLHFLFFFFLAKFSLDEFSVITGGIVMKFGDMVDMDVKLCNMVSNSKCRPLSIPVACTKPPNFCQDYFSLITEGVVLKFFSDKY